MKKVLVIIDVQNDYFANGNLPLWNVDKTLDSILSLIENAKAAQIPVVLIQHVTEPGTAPFFVKGSKGGEIHDRILEALPHSPVVQKEFADAFYKTNLEQILDDLRAEHILLCGMMTQNCVTHTALSRTADKYKKISVIPEACTTVSELVHVVSIGALVPRDLIGSMFQ